MSCDDEVLNDVYEFWTPPLRKLPPLVLIRIKTDMEEYIGKSELFTYLMFMLDVLFGLHNLENYKRTNKFSFCSSAVGGYSLFQVANPDFLGKQP